MGNNSSVTASCHFPFLEEWKTYCNSHAVCGFIDSVLSGYAQLAFNDNTFSGILMLIATWLGSPTLCHNALWGTIAATFVAKKLKIDEGAIRAGIYGANAALASLAIPPLLFPSQSLSFSMLLVTTVISIFTVIAVKVLGKYFTKWDLPSLVVPYCIALSIAMLILAAAGISHPASVSLDALFFTVPLSGWSFSELVTTFFNCASQILWLSHPLSGILYLIALLFASRKDTFNTMLAIIASIFASVLLGLPKDAVLSGLYGYNAILLTQVLSRGFLSNRKSVTLRIGMALFSPVMCCIYQLILPHLRIGSFLALPYLTIVYLIFANRKRLHGFTYVSAKYWGVPETIANIFEK